MRERLQKRSIVLANCENCCSDKFAEFRKLAIDIIDGYLKRLIGKRFWWTVFPGD